MEATNASAALVGTERVIDALSAALRRVIEPDTKLMFEERSKPADFGFSIAVCVEDSGEGPWNQVFAYAVLTKSAPLNVAKKNVTHCVEERSHCHGKVLVKVWLPTALVEAGNMCI